MDDERTVAELARLARMPLDDVDAATMLQMRDLYEAVDPVPDDLVDRIRFSLALDEVYDEVARMTRMPLDALAVRSDQPATRTETVTFSADRLTAMVTVNRVAPAVLRLDGWLTPAEPCRVRLRIQGGGEHETMADEDGRFSFDGLPDGFGQLSFHPVAAPPGADGAGDGEGDGEGDGAGDGENAVVTPLFQL